MRHIKTYELSHPKSSELIPEYSGLVYIDRPSETYFKSTIRFSLVFVDKVYEEIYDFNSIKGYGNEDFIQYNIKSDITFQRSEYSSGDNYSVINWDQDYSKSEFKRIIFMTTQEFYDKYKGTFMKILEIIFDKLDNKNLRDDVKKEFEDLLDKMTIPKVEHIINARKYNL